jgi:excisionase family DNA binding protein
MTPTPDKDWLTTKEAMAYLGIKSHDKIHRLCHAGKLAFKDMGGSAGFRISAVSIEKFLESPSEPRPNAKPKPKSK